MSQKNLTYVDGSAAIADKKGRVFTIVCKAAYLTLERIKEGLQRSGSIKHYAYILHDSDGVEDHWHIVVCCYNPTKYKTIANTFGVPVELVRKWAGDDAFLRRCRYLTHEEHEQYIAGKHMYPDSAVTSDFNFREKLKELGAKEAYSAARTPKSKTALRASVSSGKMTLAQAQLLNPHWAVNDATHLEKLRLEYLTTQPLPTERLNMYISGIEGNHIARANLARLVARGLGGKYFADLDPDMLYYEVMAGSNFNGYDGQPIIIWHGYDAQRTLKIFPSVEAILSFFETHPSRDSLPTLAGGLVNAINIFESEETFEDFQKGLYPAIRTGGDPWFVERDMKQALSEDFPIKFEHVTDKQADMYISSGFVYGTQEFEEYINYKTIVVSSFRRLATDKNLQNQILEVVAPVLHITDKFKQENANRNDDFKYELIDQGIDKYVDR